jgi:hypothetical protein
MKARQIATGKKHRALIAWKLGEYSYKADLA